MRTGETDTAGRLAVPALCNYLQEAASNSAHALDFSVEQLPGLTWVLVRLHVLVARFPRWREEVRVETWPAGVQGRYALREYLVHDGRGEVAARATSAWVLIDIAARRPVGFPAALTSLPAAERPRALPDPFERLPSPPAGTVAEELVVRPSDQDMNRHANHVRYITWALDRLPPELVDGLTLERLEVHFRAEAVAGDRLAVAVRAAVPPEPGTFLHRVYRVADGRDAALLRSHWR